MVKCEYCGENEAVFKIEVESPDGTIEHGDKTCANCIATWFTETPEDVQKLYVRRIN